MNKGNLVLPNFRKNEWNVKLDNGDVYGIDLYDNKLISTQGNLITLGTDKILNFTGIVNSRVRFYNNGTKIVVVKDSGELSFFSYDLLKNTIEKTKTLNFSVSEISWGIEIINDEFLIIAGNANIMAIIDLTRQSIVKVEKFSKRMMSVSGKDNIFICGGWDDHVRMYSLMDFSLLKDYDIHKTVYSVYYENENEFYVGVPHQILQYDKNGNIVRSYKVPFEIKVFSLLKFNDIFVFTSFMHNPNDKKVFFVRENEYEILEFHDTIWEIKKSGNSFLVGNQDKFWKYEFIQNFLGLNIKNKVRISNLENIYFSFS